MFAVSIFISSTILFLVQPMIGKAILPDLGGSPSVWNTCMFFYQILLLFGYAYAYFLTSRFSIKKQKIIHFSVLAISLISMPLGLKYVEIDNSYFLTTLSILILTIGFPFFILSTSSPLLQRWYSLTDKHPNPYPLYIVSNFGNLLALFAYPFVLEIFVPLNIQMKYWSLIYVVYIVCVFICGYYIKEKNEENKPAEAPEFIIFSRKLSWIFWGFVPSSLMLGITFYMTNRISPMPLLWTLPLGIYILSFIMVFSSYSKIFLKISAVLCPYASIFALCFALMFNFNDSGLRSIVAIAFILFIQLVICVFFHGLLSKDKPSPSSLTSFYFFMSIGGALGGLFNSFIAPLLFDSFIELQLILGLAVVYSIFYLKYELKQNIIIILVLILSIIIINILMYIDTKSFDNSIDYHEKTIHKSRNFLGIIEVKDLGHNRVLLHSDGTTYGIQRMDEPTNPKVYYGNESPVEDIFKAYSDVSSDWEIAFIGLGAGTVLCYTQGNQNWDIFEIDEDIVNLNIKEPNHFSFIKKCTPNAKIYIGDGRKELEKQDKIYDMIMVDVFLSHYIPPHMITDEAMQLYMNKLSPDGILVLHISAKSMDIEPVVRALVNKNGLYMAARTVKTDFENSPRWVVISKNKEKLAPLFDMHGWIDNRKGREVYWSDDLNSFLPIIRFERY